MLEDKKDVTVAEKLGSASLDESFRRKPRGGVEDEQYNNLISITSQVLLPQMIDRWSWSLEASGDFSVSSVRHHIDEVTLPSSDVPSRWIKTIPIKTNILAWKISLDSLPTRFNLSARGLEIQSILCPLCNVAAETPSHTFFACNLAGKIMHNICRWWDLDTVTLHTCNEWLSWLSNVQLIKKKKDVL